MKAGTLAKIGAALALSGALGAAACGPLERAVVTLVAGLGAAAHHAFERSHVRVVRGPRLPLIPPLVSLASPDEVRVALGRPTNWHVFEDRNRKPCKSAAPTYRTMWVELVGFTFLGHEATLRLHFWNGRLADTRLYPVHEDEVVADLEPKLGVRLKRHPAGHLLALPSEDIMVVAHTDGWGPYVSWQDMRLLSESDDWYRLYGEEPDCGTRR